MQQAMRNSGCRGAGSWMDAVRKKISLAGVLAGELVALASMITALAAGLLVLTTLLSA
jgi:hypothetical protein